MSPVMICELCPELTIAFLDGNIVADELEGYPRIFIMTTNGRVKVAAPGYPEWAKTSIIETLNGDYEACSCPVHEGHPIRFAGDWSENTIDIYTEFIHDEKI